MVCGLSRFCWHRESAKKAWRWGAIKLLCVMATSSHGIHLEPLRCGTQQLWHRGEVPITLLRSDMPEVDREVGEQRWHVPSLLIPPLHTGHRECMPKRHQAGTATPIG